MKVQDSIEVLEGMDPDADVFIMSQSNWPFEHILAGICQRADFVEDDDDEEIDEDEPTPRDRWSARDSQLPKSDVFLVEGQQLRYGDKRAWDTVR